MASESQIEKLVKPMKHAGYDVFCFVSTGHLTRASMSLIMEWYKECMPPVESAYPTFRKTKGKTFSRLAIAISRYGNYTRHFAPADYFMLLRPDLILKRDLFSLWDQAKEHVAYPFKMDCRLNGGLVQKTLKRCYEG